MSLVLFVERAELWLATDAHDVGLRSSVDVQKWFG